MELRQFKKLLRKNSNTITKPRLRLFAILQQHPSLTLKQLIRLLNKHDQVTVYRNIDLFEKLGIVNRLQLGWLTKIELSDIFHHHHHHFSCINCGRVIVLREDPVIEKHIAQATKRRGFKTMDHQLEIRGLCPKCL